MFKKILRMFKCEKGELILGTLVITGLIALGVGLYSLGKASEKTMENRVDVTKYDVINVSGDPGKDHEKNSAALIELAIKGGETAAGIYDDTGLLIILDKSGALKVTDKTKTEDIKNDENIKAKLKSSGLSDNKLIIDSAKAIKKQVAKKASGSVSEENIDKLIYDILLKIEKDSEAFEQLEDIDDQEIIDFIEQSLQSDGKLIDPEIIELKTQLSSLESEKKYLEEKLESFKYYEDKGYIITNASGLGNLNERLDDVEKKIVEINDKLNSKVQVDAIVTMYGQGNLLGFTESNIEIVVDLSTGIVTGNINCKGSQPAPDGSDMRCRYVFSSILSGTIDLQTYKLSASADGYVKGVSGGVCSNVKDTYYKTTLTGTLNEAATYISGTSKMGGTWSASR